MLANRLGKVVPCITIKTIGYRDCGHACSIFREFVIEASSGKVKEKFRDPGNKTDES
jgi:hypothetical protein